MNIYSFTAACFAIIGQVALIYKKVWSFYFYSLSNLILSCYFLFIVLDYSLVVMNLVFLILNVVAIKQWGK